MTAVATMPTTNKFSVGKLSFEAFGDRILVQEDDFKSGYECRTCGGTGISPLNPNMRCKDCEGNGATIIIPDIGQRRPTTGRIVSIGPEVRHLRVGQSVMFSNFAGHATDLTRAGKPVVLRTLHESEILALIDGHLELRAGDLKFGE